MHNQEPRVCASDKKTARAALIFFVASAAIVGASVALLWFLLG